MKIKDEFKLKIPKVKQDKRINDYMQQTESEINADSIVKADKIHRRRISRTEDK